MAMMKCPECQEEVSSTAMKCPKCGFQINKPKRTFMGKVFKWLFILYNLLMVVWLMGGMAATSEMSRAAATSAEQAGVAIGTGLGMSMILTFWAVGDVILGLPVLFTRPKG